MRLTNPYRIIFLYPRYQQIVSASSLLGILVGLFVLFQSSMALAAYLHIPQHVSLWTHPEGPWWLACVLTGMPFMFYGSVMGMACISGSYLVLDGAMSWRDMAGYVTQSKWPAHWFAHKPWF